MKKWLVTGLLTLLTALPASAQFSRINTITLQNSDASQAAFYASPFTLKLGADCAWTVTGTVAVLDCNGMGMNPASPSGSIQYNNGGAFASVPAIKAGSADCDGSGNPCAFEFIDPDTFTYFIYGTDPMGAMGNTFDLFYGQGWELDDNDGTYNSAISASHGTGNTFISQNGALGETGLKLESSNRLVAIGRLQFSGTYLSIASATNFTAGAGWGSTATFTPSGGSDNLFVFNVTAGGTGITSNPTFTYTYVDGDMSTGSSVVAYVCTQTGGNDTVVPSGSVITTTRNQTNEVFTWVGLPTTGKSYEITCFGAASN